MRFIPLEPLIINTPLTPEVSRALLAAAVTPGALGGTEEPGTPLRGTVGLATFALRRATRLPSALLPEFRGRIDPRDGGARLTGMVSLGPLPVVVLSVTGLAALAASVGALPGASGPGQPLAIAPLGAVVLAWILLVRGVTAETRRLRRLVRALLLPPPADRNGPPAGAL